MIWVFFKPPVPSLVGSQDPDRVKCAFTQQHPLTDQTRPMVMGDVKERPSVREP